MKNQYIAVGDIHGCPQQLDEILELGRAYPDHRWIFLGDYIDRGPDNEGVLARLRKLDAVFLRGNHEEMLLARLEGAKRPSARNFWALHAKVRTESLDWLESALVDRYETPDYLFVHGGLDPQKPMERQTRWDFLWTRYQGDYRHLTQKWVIHGHTVLPEPEIVGNRININTGCGGGGPLTALVLPEFQYLTSSPSPRPYLSPQVTAQELEDLLEEL